nr:unnamed protein product [Callosobruchus analis]
MILSRCLPFRLKHSCKAVFIWLETAKHICCGIPLMSSRIFCVFFMAQSWIYSHKLYF